MGSSDTKRIAYFNPRTHVGCDQADDFRAAATGKFQSTHPRGVRQLANVGVDGNTIFQSTHPRGVRLRATGQNQND